MTEPLRALIVEPDSQTGHWLYSVTLAHALRERGIDVRLATFFPYERVEGINGIPISIIGRRVQDTDRMPRDPLRWIFDHAQKVARLAEVLHEFRPAVAHLHGPVGKLDFSYFALMKRFGAKVVYTVHDMVPTPSYWLEMVDRLRVRAADRILVHSRNGAAAVRSYGVDETRIVQIPHVSYHHLVGNGGLSRGEAKASLGLPDGASALLFFGNIEPRKGLDLLIDAYASLIRRDSSIYLIVAGKPYQDFAPYLNRITRLNLANRVILDLRYVPFDRMRVYFSAADVVVLPYRRIHQSGVLQWAYAFGRPVVVTDVGGISEAVTADSTGVVAAGTDGEALARAIFSLLRNGALAREMGDRGAVMARTKYSSEVVSEKLETVYRELTSVSPSWRKNR